MNTLYFVYAIEVEKTGSITQAADNLFMSQPTLSKAIKDLEETLGFAVFKRTPRGVVPTRKGAEFLIHARKIVGHIKKMELALQTGEASHQTFSIAIPRVEYVAEAVSSFIRSLDLAGDMEFDILEANSMRAINAVAGSHFVLGVIRYHPEDEEYFLRSLAEKDLQHQLVWEADYTALMRADHPLAGRGDLVPEDLAPYIEVAFGDDDVPYVRVSEADSGASQGGRRVLVYARATQLDLLRTNPLAFTWASPMSVETLRDNGLVQRRCAGCGRFRDVLISRNGYRLSAMDRAFLEQLANAARG